MARKKEPDAQAETAAPARNSAPVKAGDIAKKVAPRKPAARKPKAAATKAKPAAPAKKPAAKARGEAKAKTIKPISKRPPRLAGVKAVAPGPVSPITEEVIAEALEELSPKELQFCEAYLTCFNGTKSWKATYGAKTDNSAATLAADKLRRTHIRAYLAKRMKASFDEPGIASDRLIQNYEMTAFGDINELVEYRLESCRFCHGDDHLYQHTPQEYRNRESGWRKHLKEEGLTEEECPFDPKGGVGFDPRKDPHEDCPECHGEGIGRVIFKDSRKLSPAGLALYAGAKISKDGIEVKTVSQEKSREMLARILKLFEEKEVKVSITMDVETLEEKFASKMQAAHARMQQVMEERGMGGGAEE